MKKLCLLMMVCWLAMVSVCFAYHIDEDKWQRVESDCELFYEKESVMREDGVCRITVLMAIEKDGRYLISDYQIYRDTETIVTLKHDIYDYDTDRKLHTVKYPSYSPKHVPINLHENGEALYRIAWSDEKAE